VVNGMIERDVIFDRLLGDGKGTENHQRVERAQH